MPYRNTGNSLGTEHRVPPEYHSTWRDGKLFIVSSGAGELRTYFPCVG